MFTFYFNYSAPYRKSHTNLIIILLRLCYFFFCSKYLGMFKLSKCCNLQENYIFFNFCIHFLGKKIVNICH